MEFVSSYLKFWRGAGVVERGGLENRCGQFDHRGFESLSLRKKNAVCSDSNHYKQRLF